MLLKVEKGIRSGICHAIHLFLTANNKYMKYYDKNKESLFLNYWGVHNLYGSANAQNLHVGGFKWVENISKCSKCFIDN